MDMRKNSSTFPTWGTSESRDSDGKEDDGCRVLRERRVQAPRRRSVQAELRDYFRLGGQGDSRELPEEPEEGREDGREEGQVIHGRDASRLHV